MTVLLGIELAGDEALLSVVDRRGAMEAWCNEPLTAPAGDWTAIHPEERVRAVVQLLERGMREGLLHGGNIAGIGLAAEPGWVFLDHELKAIPPRDLQWPDVLAAIPDATPAAQLAALVEKDPTLPRKVRVVFSTLDYLRFRLTGALATSVSFAWWSGLLSPELPTEWDAAAVAAAGFTTDALPPILPASERVGTVQGEISTQCGFPAGVWVHAGADPVSSALLFAADPDEERAVCEIDESGVVPWRFGEAPQQSPGSGGADALPTAVSGVWLHRVDDAGWSDPRTVAEWYPRGEQPPVVTFREDLELERWPAAALADGVGVASDAGGPSVGVALQAGLGLGWWRDRRVLWRKHLFPFAPAEWLALNQSPGASS
ncbi:MAG: FGGY family carbohydrate kinase [Planctomycetota bacterium]